MNRKYDVRAINLYSIRTDNNWWVEIVCFDLESRTERVIGKVFNSVDDIGLWLSNNARWVVQTQVFN